MRMFQKLLRSLPKVVVLVAVFGLACPFLSHGQCGPIGGCRFEGWVACAFPNYCSNGCDANMCVYQCGGTLLYVPTVCCQCI